MTSACASEELKLKGLKGRNTYPPCVYKVNNQLPSNQGYTICRVGALYTFRTGEPDETQDTGVINAPTGSSAEVQSDTDACVLQVDGVTVVCQDGEVLGPVYSRDVADADRCLVSLEYTLSIDRDMAAGGGGGALSRMRLIPVAR